jgi:hypothetical protein
VEACLRIEVGRHMTQSISSRSPSCRAYVLIQVLLHDRAGFFDEHEPERLIGLHGLMGVPDEQIALPSGILHRSAINS